MLDDTWAPFLALPDVRRRQVWESDHEWYPALNKVEYGTGSLDLPILHTLITPLSDRRLEYIMSAGRVWVWLCDGLSRVEWCMPLEAQHLAAANQMLEQAHTHYSQPWVTELRHHLVRLSHAGPANIPFWDCRPDWLLIELLPRSLHQRSSFTTVRRGQYPLVTASGLAWTTADDPNGVP